MAEEHGPPAATRDEVPEDVRRRMVLALDVDDLVVARRLARQLQPLFGTMKVGFELYTAAGPEAISMLAGMGVDVFCDVKLLDIPNTVGRAARVIGALGARYLTLHTSGGAPMLRAGVEGLREGAAGAELPEPVAMGVTVLTSEPEASHHLLHQRVTAGLDGGCGGFVCAVSDIETIRRIAPAAVLATPGIRPEGAGIDDQGRVATPRHALESGADLLIVGRPVTRAPDPLAAARALVAPLV
ncbi:MAG TPA: orotidine-5'-phosphate decarboxylase [Acidimicrobiales bacterium]|nr:orotidine-5'-phosphate decarboxylase [Acidimicrobiales bacterium]